MREQNLTILCIYKIFTFILQHQQKKKEKKKNGIFSSVIKVTY